MSEKRSSRESFSRSHSPKPRGVPNEQGVARKMRGSLIMGICFLLTAAGASAWTLRPTPPKLAAAPVAKSTTPEWLDNVERAMKVAHAQHKDLLLQFSGPSLDPRVASLDRTLFDKDEFRQAMGGRFVLVRLGATPETPPGRATQITVLAQSLGVARFPTFILLDSEGKPYAKSELIALDAGSYENEFDRLRGVRVRRDEALARAAAARGVERARQLDAALTTVGTFAESNYLELQREVVDLDPQDIAGLRSKYRSRVVSRLLDSTIQSEVYPLVDRGRYAAAIARIERLIMQVKPPRPQLQLLLAFQGQLSYSLGDRARAIRLLDEAIAIDPASDSANRARAAKVQLAAVPRQPTTSHVD